MTTTSDTYINLLVQQFIQDSLQQGQVLTDADIADYIQSLSQQDFSVPQFNSQNATVQHLENASAGKTNYTYQTIRQDLTVLYRELLALSKTAMQDSDRWLAETTHLEKQIEDLDQTVTDLLFGSQNTIGLFASVGDNFTDTSLIDTTISTINVDTTDNYVTLGPSANSVAQLVISPSAAINFKLRTQNNLVQQTFNSDIQDIATIFTNSNQSTGNNQWQATAQYSSNPGVVMAELNIQLAGGNPVDISKIQLATSQSTSLQVTPMTSLDNINWSQLPSVTTTQLVTGTSTFIFPTTSAVWIKFILSKQSADNVTNNPTVYSYEFGFQSISFWQNAFPVKTTETLYSIPLWVADSNGDPQQFSKLSLNTCEQIEDNTSISYYLTTSNDSTVPVTDQTQWSAISPSQYTNPQNPTILDINNTTTYEYSGLLSYNPSGVVSGYNSFKNPASPFFVITSGISGPTTVTGVTTSGQRYHAGNPDNYILNYQIDQSVSVDPRSLEIFRNVGVQGLSIESGLNTVRSNQLGWGYDGKIYSTMIQIDNPAGITINFGPSPLTIDGTLCSGTVGPNVLTGITPSTNGIHNIQINSTNWQYIPSGLTTSGLQNGGDPLYPFNQRYLIEGYLYSPSDTATPVYIGVSLWAQYYLKELSPFDMIHNVSGDSLQYFAQDLDIPGTHNGGNTAQTVFVVKVDTSFADWLNEKYSLSLKLTDQLRTYLRFRADMQTTNSNNTPALGSYSIKLG